MMIQNLYDLSVTSWHYDAVLLLGRNEWKRTLTLDYHREIPLYVL